MDTTIKFAWTVCQDGDGWLVEQESNIPVAPVAFATKEEAVAYAEGCRVSANAAIRQFQQMASRLP